MSIGVWPKQGYCRLFLKEDYYVQEIVVFLFFCFGVECGW